MPAKLRSKRPLLVLACCAVVADGFVHFSPPPLRAMELGAKDAKPDKANVNADELSFASAKSSGSLTVLRPPVEEATMPPPLQVIDAPSLITFSEGTLFRLAEPVGMHYREVLFKHTGLRLPRPDIFTRAYQEVYDAKTAGMPCFGCGESLSSRDWWWGVVWDTYMEVGVPEEVMAPLMPIVFDELYDTVFTGTEGWELTEDALYVLDRLKAQQKALGDRAPKLGVIANFDERLHKILEVLGIDHYFDVVLTSKECGMEKPARQIFDIALTRLGIYDRPTAVHIGDAFAFDVEGAAGAGWQALYVQPPPFGDKPPNPEKLPYQRCGDLLRVLEAVGLMPDMERPIATTAPRGIYEVWGNDELWPI